MCYEPELVLNVYSRYLNGASIDDIVNYIVFFTDYHDIRNNDVEKMIDFMNKFI